MDSNILVDKQYEEGKKLIEKLDKQGYKYPVILWLNIQNGWTLLFGIPNLQEKGTKEIFKLMHKNIIKNNIELSLNNISFIDTSSEICQNLKMFFNTGDTIQKISFNGNVINGRPFPDSLIYRVNLQ